MALKPGRRKLVAVLVAVAVVSSVIVIAFYLNQTRGPCSKPPGTFLIVANVNGYNDSIDHGVPQNSWPIITVQKGTTVTVTLCNADVQPHGFQITNYHDSPIESLAPGKSLTLTFVANMTGTFRIYCSIFCTVHGFMQSGELIVR
jgi:heme/copper-type cytochrome/quinol oxidase subunit 2